MRKLILTTAAVAAAIGLAGCSEKPTLVNAPREAWYAYTGGLVEVKTVALTFMPDSSFIYRTITCYHCEGASWEELEETDGTKGTWKTDGDTITMVFHDGYAITAPYAVTDVELTFNFGDGCDERLGCGGWGGERFGRYEKQRISSN
jgi:hypothetical protein